MKTQAYLYKWTQKTTGKWYIGSRTKLGCHPMDGYICSSKIKEDIEANINDWCREILVIGPPEYIRKLENQYLLLLNAKNDPNSFNKHNGDGKFTTTGKVDTAATKAKKSAAKKGKGIGPDNNFYGRKHTPESIEKSRRVGIENGLYGKFGPLHPAFGIKRSDETKLKLSNSKIGDNHPSKKPANRRTCEHCKLELTITNYVRWHGINCKKGIKNEST